MNRTWTHSAACFKRLTSSTDRLSMGGLNDQCSHSTAVLPMISCKSSKNGGEWRRSHQQETPVNTVETVCGQQIPCLLSLIDKWDALCCRGCELHTWVWLILCYSKQIWRKTTKLLFCCHLIRVNKRVKILQGVWVSVCIMEAVRQHPPEMNLGSKPSVDSHSVINADEASPDGAWICCRCSAPLPVYVKPVSTEA